MSVSNQDVLCLHWTSGEYYRGCPGRSCVEYFGHCTYHGLCPQPMVCVDGCRGPMGARTVPSPSSGTPSERFPRIISGNSAASSDMRRVWRWLRRCRDRLAIW